MIIKALLRSQQFALKELNLYAGEIDGIWGPSSQQAIMGLIYRDGGHQTHGKPFTVGNKLPRGMAWAELDGQPVVALVDEKERDGGEAFLRKFRAAVDPQQPKKAKDEQKPEEPVKQPDAQGQKPAEASQQTQQEQFYKRRNK